MNIWGLQLKVDNGKHTFEETLDFCIRDNTIGVGWAINKKQDD